MPSGIYLFKDQGGKVIYVGKAIDLKKRVASYFSKSYHDVKTLKLIEQIATTETIPVESELEALILEANLIKRYLPRFNVRLTDDKDYLYIGIAKEDFPKITTARKKDLKIMKKYWGPFPSSKTVRDTLFSLRKIFPWCTTGRRPLGMDPKGRTLRTYRSCFYYHLGLCPGACVGLITGKEYNKIIHRFSKFLEGKKAQILKELTKEMEQASKHQNYEHAAKVKKMIDGINYLTQPNRTRFYLENPNFLDMETRQALGQLRQDLGLKDLPKRIEAYDISNIQGKDATGSMVVLTNGEIDKSNYRKFKIYLSGRPNDVGMMKEMLRRRLTHKDWPYPDLILVDGAKAQAKAAGSVLLQEDLDIPVFGLAKKMEWIYPSEGEVIKLKKVSLALKLLQKIRDEAHRFAISYHRKLRDMMIFR